MRVNKMNNQEEKIKQLILKDRAPKISQEFIKSTVEKSMSQISPGPAFRAASVLVFGHYFSYKQVALLVMAIIASLILTQQYLDHQEDDLTRIDALSMTTLLSL
jgi:hypothetical protein